MCIINYIMKYIKEYFDIINYSKIKILIQLVLSINLVYIYFETLNCYLSHYIKYTYLSRKICI